MALLDGRKKPRTPKQALAFEHALAESSTLQYDQRCKELARTAYGIQTDGTSTAREAAAKTKHRGEGEPVEGALLWWLGGSSGHVAIADGKGGATANSYKHGGRVRLLPLSFWNSSMGGKWAFWSHDIDGEIALPLSAVKPKPPAVTYTVKQGDTLSEIALRFHTTVALLVKANKLADPDMISVGQKLKLPKGK